MDDDQMETLSVTFLFILIFIFSSVGFYNMGAYFTRKEATNETTIECIEKPNVCKDRYEYLKLGEKLQENQK
jgi:hypothetical protein